MRPRLYAGRDGLPWRNYLKALRHASCRRVGDYGPLTRRHVTVDERRGKAEDMKIIAVWPRHFADVDMPSISAGMMIKRWHSRVTLTSLVTRRRRGK